MVTKLIDKKGRLMLGAALAGRMVIVDDSDPECIVIKPAVAIPEREAWLYKNEKALKQVREGLAQARRGEVAQSPPDLDADQKLIDQLDD